MIVNLAVGVGVGSDLHLAPFRIGGVVFGIDIDIGIDIGVCVCVGHDE